MPSPVLSHALAVEFPDLSEIIHTLKTSDHHFKHLLDQHDAVDRKITDSEEEKTALDDDTMKALKIERLHLKEQLHKIALKNKH